MQTTGTMGADFSKFQRVLRFRLQILPADNLKGLRTQPSTGNRRQNTGTNAVEIQGVHSLPLLNSNNLLS
jgi:hypothetical protein